MGLTTDPTDPRLGHGPNDAPVPQNETYLVLSEEERAKGFVRPVRHSYRHARRADAPAGTAAGCGAVTTMAEPIAETYARQPNFYGATYCTTCMRHLPLAEFVWTDDGTQVGS